MIYLHRWPALAVLLAAASGLAAQPKVSGGKEGAQTNVILVHGAFADASSWRKVIPLLEAKNLHVVAVQLPETSLEEDVAATRRALSIQKGAVVLVGHSYGGMVITAAADDPNVRALVYVTALMPEQGESAGDLIGRFPPTQGGKHIVRQAGDFLWVDPSAYHEMFCPDVPAADARVMVAVQKPINSAAFGAKLTSVARWHDLPTWYVVTSQDKMLSPDLQKFLAQRAKAKISTVASSHVPFLSKPQEVAKVIVEAALYKEKPQP
jgi:pimeloyl-ACP methyl ester carboxylesterase